MAGGTLYGAGRYSDRVLAVVGSQLQGIYQPTPVAGIGGADGIAALGDSLLLPEGLRGRLLLISTSATLERSASGFDRPTGVWPLSDGNLLVGDEIIVASSNFPRTGQPGG